MSKHFEQDYSAPGSQPELPAELLPTPVDGSISNQLPLANEQNKEQAEQTTQDSRVPETAKPVVTKHLIEVSDDFDRVDAQAQTTSGRGTRERAGIADPDDADAQAASAARKLLATSPITKSKPTRRGLSARGRLTADGPPPHIAEDVRRAQGLIE